MVTGDQELQWAYLLCPTFELSNSEGKPLTNGYIELYIAGTRDKYYAASDFAGTLHPFQIPLDSLGSNIVLVSPDNAYDIYVYNRFGNLVMSRYNVVPTNGAAGGGSSSSNISIESGDGTVVVTESTDPETGVKTFDLSVPSVSGNPSFWTGRGAATMGVTISDTEYHKLDISNHSIRNRNDDITVVNGEFNLKKGVYFWNVTVQLDKYEGHDNTRQRVFIESGYNRGAYTMDMTHDESETISFSGITVTDYDDTKQDIKIKSEGESSFKATLYNVSIHKLNQNVLGDNGTTYTAGDYIEITEDDVINVTGLTTPEDVEAMIDAAITAMASGDIYTGGDYINIDNHVISVTGLQPEGNYLTPEDLEGYATETYVDNSVSSFTTHTEVYESTVTAIQAATGAIPEQLEAGDYIAIIDNKINVTGLQEAGDYATNTEVYEAIVTGIQAATSEIPDVSDFATHTEVYESSVTSIQLVTGLIPDVSDLATRDEVYEAVVTGIQLATSMIPDQLEAGDYVSIINNTINVTGLQPEGDYLTQEDLEGYATEEYVTTYVDNSVSSFVTEEQVTAMFPETEDVTFKELDITQFAMASAIPVVTGFATHTEVYESTVTAVQLATAQIPDQLEAGDYVSIVNNTINVTGLQPEGDYATNADVHEATVTAIEHVTALIPEAQVQSDWTEADNTDPSYIQHKPEEVRLVAGDNVTITETATSVVISASGGGSEYTAGANIYIDNNEIGVTDVIDIYARPETASGMLKLGNIAHWGNIDYGPGLYLRSTMDDDFDNRTFRWYITGDHGIENRFWGAYDDSRPDSAVSAESFIHIREGDIYYKQGEYQNVNTLPMIWSCSGMRYDIDRLQEAVTAIPAAQVQSNWTQVDTADPSYIQNKPTEKFLVGGDNVIITETATSVVISAQGGGTTYTAGQYISIDSNDVIAVTGLSPVSGSDGITVNNNMVSLDTPVEIVAGDNITISVTGASAIFSAANSGATQAEVYDATVTGVQTATGWVNSQGYLTEVPSTYATDTEVSEAIASSITDFVTEGEVTALIPDSEEVQFEELDITQFAQASAIPTIELNDDDQVTAIDGHMLAGGGQSDSNVAVYTNSNLPDSTQLDADIAAGKAICIIYSGRNYWYDRHSSDYYFYGADAYSGFLYYLYYRPSNNRWFSGQKVMATETWVNTNYLPDSAIELNDNNQVSGISGHPLAGGGGTTYTAGQYISIDANNEISVTGLQVAGSYATTSDISDMATKTWVGNQGYLTAVPNTYATKVYVDSAVSGKQDKLTAGSNISISGNTIAVTGMPASPVQSDWNVTNSSSLAYIKNKPTIPSISGCALKSDIAWIGWDWYTQGVNYITNNNVGQAGFRFYPGNLFTAATLQHWTYSESPVYTGGTTPGAVFIRFCALLNNVVGTQWTSHNNVIQLNKGHIMEYVYEVCGDGWNSGNIVLKTDGSWTQSVQGILRDVRNSSTADNNTYYLHFSAWVGI